MPFIAAFISALTTPLMYFYGLLIVKRLLFFAAAVGLMAAATSLFFTGISELVNSLSYQVPQEIVTGCRIFLPDNFLGCVSAIFSAYALRYTYDWSISLIRMQV